MFFSFEDEMFTFVSIMKLVHQFRKFFLASLSFCLFLIIFFLVLLFFFFFFIPKETKSACFSTTTTHQQTQRKNNNKRKSIDPSSNQNARRATIGRVLRRTRERARREAIERDRSSSGGEHREEQFRTRWVGQGIIVKILFSIWEKVNVGIAMDRFFLSLSLSLLKALRRARRLAEVLYLCIKLTSSFLF